MQACLTLHNRGLPGALNQLKHHVTAAPVEVSKQRTLQGDFVSREEFLPLYLFCLVIALATKQGQTHQPIPKAKGTLLLSNCIITFQLLM